MESEGGHGDQESTFVPPEEEPVGNSPYFGSSRYDAVLPGYEVYKYTTTFLGANGWYILLFVVVAYYLSIYASRLLTRAGKKGTRERHDREMEAARERQQAQWDALAKQYPRPPEKKTTKAKKDDKLKRSSGFKWANRGGGGGSGRGYGGGGGGGGGHYRPNVRDRYSHMFNRGGGG